MSRPRKQPEWIRPTAAGRIVGVTRQTIMYRAGLGRYRTRLDHDTGLTLVNRRDVMKDAPPKQAAA